MVEEHGVGRSQLRNLVQAPANKVSGGFAVALRRKIRGFSVYNRLGFVSIVCECAN